MRNLFLHFFEVIRELGIKNNEAMKIAWKIAKLQGKKEVSFMKNSGVIVTRQSCGSFTPKLTKSGEVMVTFSAPNGDIKSFNIQKLV